ncbi:MAG TPA: beta-L-arabinofuranosidase domain-containing protein [Chitinophagaceae bacterium]|nr:beta-L-arabinofuranosidase domain-containing protein [Chitinophagaceae bacterium]
MNAAKHFLISSLLLVASLCGTGQDGRAERPSRPRHFRPAVYTALPLGSIRPQGWLLHQLRIMRAGSTGHLDEVYGKVQRDNGWLGGKGDGWEETPYWLDGAVPLAYLLEDAELKNKVLRYINWTLDNQRPSGYFGPLTRWERDSARQLPADSCAQGDDWWPKMIMLKVLQQYYTATKDPRVIPFMSRFFAYQLRSLRRCPVGKWTEWAQSRGADNVLVAQWLYTITKEKSLLELCDLLQAQSFAWSNWFCGRNWVINAATLQNGEAWMTRHGVNVAMGLKDPVVHYQRRGDPRYLEAFRTGFTDLMTLHGLPFGMFSADEDLHGNDPTQGTELCAIVEAMFSLEEAVGITGDPQYMDALERMTYNALPAQTTDDYNSKQYFQIANQVQIARGVFNFSLPFQREMNNVLGMRSGYTCCLANMHQGWTKFATHLWYGTKDNGLAALQYAPSTVTVPLGKRGTPVTVTQSTTYPFSDGIDFTITAAGDVAFPLHLRIPGWCRQGVVLLNGDTLQQAAGGTIAVLNRTWKNGDRLTLRLPMEVRTSNWGKNSRAVERGPLVYALKLQERWVKGVDSVEGDYYSVYPEGAWNYGLTDSVVRFTPKAVTVREVKPVTGSFVWNLANAPLELRMKARRIPDWQLLNGVAPQPVTARDGLYMGRVEPRTEEIVLVPFGCTKVRIVAFPVVP